MILSILDQLYAMLYSNLWLAVVGSFLWGVSSVLLSPCHLSSIPLVMGFVAKESHGTQGRAIVLSTTFTLGIMVSMLLLGLVTAALGRLLGDVGSVGNWLGVGVFSLVGLMLWDVVHLPGLSMRSQDRFRGGGVPAALVLGVLFGTVLGPCAFAFLMPVLGLVFSQGGAQPIFAACLVTAYALGHGMVIVLAGSASVWIMTILHVPRFTRWIYWGRRLAGGLCILLALWFVFR